jgi:hypothetical protein
VADLNLLDEAADNNAVVADRLRGLIVEAFGLPDSPDLARAVAIAVEAGDAVLKMAFRSDPNGDPAILVEAERLLHSYLALHIEG